MRNFILPKGGATTFAVTSYSLVTRSPSALCVKNAQQRETRDFMPLRVSSHHQRQRTVMLLITIFLCLLKDGRERTWMHRGPVLFSPQRETMNHSVSFLVFQRRGKTCNPLQYVFGVARGREQTTTFLCLVSPTRGGDV
jgi:hypothetical protein